MNYQNGREAKIGDKIVHLPTGISGVLESEKPGDGRLAMITPGGDYVPFSECLHRDDVPAAAPEEPAANLVEPRKSEAAKRETR